MRTRTQVVYTAEELREANPKGFEKAFERYRKWTYEDPPWASETRSSLRAILAYFKNAPEIDGPTRLHDIRRCVAWVENNVLAALRDGSGQIPSCPLTGYCMDEDLLDFVRKEARQGRSPHDIKKGLVDETDRLLGLELESMTTEEAFLETAEANEWEFIENGSLA